MRRCLGAVLMAALPLSGWAIDEAAAIRIAEQASGCGPSRPCQSRTYLKDGKWITVVSFIYGLRDSGEPIFKPGGWVGITVDEDGKVVDTAPGR